MSETKCVLCGADLVDGVCPNLAQHVKPMCLNCFYCGGRGTDVLFCNNDDNKQDALEKIKLAVPSGYELTNIELQPLPLKDCTKKCKRWLFSTSVVGDLGEMLSKSLTK